MTHRELEEQLRSEIAERRRELSQVAGDDHVSGLVRGQLEARIATVEDELSTAINPVLVLSLTDEDGSHSVQAKRLGSILSRLQDAITRTGWALETGAEDHRDPPAQMIQATTFDVLALSPGSFEITMRHAEHEDLQQLYLDTETPSLAEEAVGKLMELFSAAEEAELDSDELEELATGLGKGPSDSVQKLLAHFVEGGLSARFELGAVRSSRAYLKPQSADRLRSWLRSVEERTERVSVRGRLTLGDEDDGNFRLVDAAGTPYEGKADPAILAGKTLGDTFDAVLDQVTAIGEHTGTVRTKWLLRSLRSVHRDDG